MTMHRKRKSDEATLDRIEAQQQAARDAREAEDRASDAESRAEFWAKKTRGGEPRIRKGQENFKRRRNNPNVDTVRKCNERHAGAGRN